MADCSDDIRSLGISSIKRKTRTRGNSGGRFFVDLTGKTCAGCGGRIRNGPKSQLVCDVCSGIPRHYPESSTSSTLTSSALSSTAPLSGQVLIDTARTTSKKLAEEA